MSETAAINEMYLPKRERFSFSDLATLLGVIIGVWGIYQLGGHQEEKNVQAAIFALTAMIVILLGHELYIFLQKKHRYAQAVFFMHYINHRIRDSLEKRRVGGENADGNVLNDIADAISTCFSVITARYCRCSIITVPDDKIIDVLARDTVSRSRPKPSDGQTHTVSKNTDFMELFKGTHWYPRCFLENNLPRLYAQKKYKNSSLIKNNLPKVVSVFNWRFVRYWPLPYKSALVLPIRYMRVAVPKTTEDFQIHGFLCIDASSKNTFNDIYDTELGCAFADVLCTYFSQIRNIKKKSLTYESAESAEETLQATMEA